MATHSLDTFGSRADIEVGEENYEIFRLGAALDHPHRLPYVLRILVEGLLRNEDGAIVTAEHIRALTNWDSLSGNTIEVPFYPGRVLMPDSTGVACVVDLAAMREAVAELGGHPHQVEPRIPAELVIDHSVIVDAFARPDAFDINVGLEHDRNRERYQLLRWGQATFDQVSVVPPGAGIVHQVNLERLARGVMVRDGVAFPDTCIGTDSHTTMVNGLGVLGWGVGGIEAESAMLGQPLSLLIPEVIGLRLTGGLQPGVTATDLVLSITELLRSYGVVGKYVEFFGPGLASVSLPNRATIANMCPEYGSTVALFPIDHETIRYLELTGRPHNLVRLVETYARAQGLWHDPAVTADYSHMVDFDLSTVVASIAGPRRPQDRIALTDAKNAFQRDLPEYVSPGSRAVSIHRDSGAEFTVAHGTVAIAAITSCTNTSNPAVMVTAGLLARNAVERGLTTKPWVKTSLAPGSRAVTDYLNRAGLSAYLDKLGFQLVGYGCTTCIGNSGPLSDDVAAAIAEGEIAAAAVLSGNRNFEGRINPSAVMNYLASPPLVIAYAIAGTMNTDLTSEPLGTSADGAPVYLTDLWPTERQISDVLAHCVTTASYESGYKDLYVGDQRWRDLDTPTGARFAWDTESTYIRRPPFLQDLEPNPLPVTDIRGARVLVKLGDAVTTDHISPAGVINPDGPAGLYLREQGVDRRKLNSFLSRRGNHEVMIRGTFSNLRLLNELLDGTRGGFTRDFTRDDAEPTTIYEASRSYATAGTALVVLGGKDYGTGSSRDWAAKGPALLGVRAVIAESFERIHRSNLIGMGILPLQLPAGTTWAGLGINGTEVFDIAGVEQLDKGIVPATLTVTATPDPRRSPPDDQDGQAPVTFDATLRIDTPQEAVYYRHGGILPFVAREMAATNRKEP